MYEMYFLRNIIKEHIEKGRNKFIIYPFGRNAVAVKNVLKDFFNIEPYYIVDNEYCKYSDKIIDGHELRENFSEDMYIILTAGNPGINGTLARELSEYVPADNIINLEQLLNEIRTGFQIDRFLPFANIIREETKPTDKIKVRFMHNTSNSWNVICSICEAFKSDPLFDVLIIIDIICKDEAVVKQVQDGGYNYIMLADYWAEIDQPDILVLNNPFNSFTKVPRCREFTKLIVVASMELIIYQDSLNEFWQQQEGGYGMFQPDYYLYDSLLYNEIKDSEYFSDKVIHMGNAKFDIIYDAMQRKQYPKGWEKLKGKRTVLWATSHGVFRAQVNKCVSFDRYAKTFFKYAADNEEMGFIFRPHSAFIYEMLELGFWPEKDFEQFKQYCSNSPNIVFDDTDTYNYAFSIADGILTDPYCGIICSALPMLKPICIAYRSKNDLPYHADLEKNYYMAYENEDIIRFLEMVRNQQDPMLELRKKASKESIKNFDGKNGWRIKEFIKDSYLSIQ